MTSDGVKGISYDMFRLADLSYRAELIAVWSTVDVIAADCIWVLDSVIWQSSAGSCDDL